MRRVLVALLCSASLLVACSEGEVPAPGDGPGVKQDGKVAVDRGVARDGVRDRQAVDLPLHDQPVVDLPLHDLSAQDLPPADLPQPDSVAPDSGPPSNDSCFNAKLLKLKNGKLTETGDSSTLKDEFAKLTCGGSVLLNGPQAYYLVFLTAAESYKITLSPQFQGYFYLFSPQSFCTEASIQKDCSSLGSTGDVSPLVPKGGSKTLTFNPSKSGYWYITVDSASAAEAGKFTLDIELDCSKYANKCNTGINNNGVCEAKPKSGTCNDEDPCTLNDACQAVSGLGICKGTAKACAGNDCNAGKCDKSSGLCVNVPLAGNPKCDDGDSCTLGDSCQAGACKGTKMDCTSVADTCNLGLCISGKCTKVPKSGKIACDDKDACTDSDTCANGTCGGVAKKCLGDQCNTGGCAVIAGKALCIKVYKKGYCNDGDPCTVTDTCNSVSGVGLCQGTTKTCPGDQCNNGKCDKTSGLCGRAYKAGTCDDKDKCTVSDACVAGSGGVGACKGAAKTCAGDQCNSGKCDAASGKCTKVYKAGSCTDGNNCTTSDACVADSTGLGSCKGSAVTCSGDQCNTAKCDLLSGKCRKYYKAGKCDDKNKCTQSDACVWGAGGVGICKGTSKACSGDQCNTAKCDANTGQCKKEHKAGKCNDGLACTTSDSCKKGFGGVGACQGTAKTCAGDQCNSGVCDKATGQCKKVLKPGFCSDANPCTFNDSCVKVLGGVGACQGTAKTCGSDQCNTGVCDKSTGQCKKVFKAGYCSDGNGCTLSDKCVNVGGVGVCKGSPKSCKADQCNTGLCDAKTGQCVTKVGACSDGNLCTLNDYCLAGKCVSGTPRSCKADQCNTGTCDFKTGLCLPKTGPCEDGNKCTLSDTCQKGVCIPGSLKTCSAKQCHTVKCTTSTGACTYSATSGGSCNDSNSCTVNDTCSSGSCKGSYVKDSYENNNTCGARKHLGQLNEGSTWISKAATISPPGDIDWFSGTGIEGSHSCWPFSTQYYYFKLRVYVPAGRTFRVCLGNNTCSPSCVVGTGTISMQYTRKGTCGYQDNTTGIFSVQAVDNKTGCQSYTVQFNYND